MKFEPRLLSKCLNSTVYLRKLSQPVALWLALLTVLCAMVFQYVTWLKGSVNGYSLFILALSQGSQFNTPLIIGLLLSILSGLFVYQALMNRIRIRELNNQLNYLKTLFKNLPGTADQIIMDENEVRIEDVISDISQQHAAQDIVRLHTEQLAQVTRVNALGEMASGFAHEINQPLAAISLFAQAGKRLVDCGQYERVPEVFDKLSQHAQRAGAIIERIQVMAKPNAYRNSKKSVYCHALIADVARLAQAKASLYDIEINITIARKLPAVMVDIDIVQIQQVTLNLLQNGIQAMSGIACRNGNKITLKASLNNRNELEIAIVDSGDGISQQVEENLFQPFSTNKETGIGMGLAISRAIIEAHSGYIKFCNNTNFGATFYFTLPTTKRDN
jgi:C4-dicarboxylate-specific signal transduction histidine kinase